MAHIGVPDLVLLAFLTYALVVALAVWGHHWFRHRK